MIRSRWSPTSFRSNLLALALPCVLACTGESTGTGTETDNPSLRMFEGSACKKDGVEDAEEGLRAAALTASDYDGLHCFAWEPAGDDVLRIDVLNATGGCLVEIEWKGSARVGEGRLALTVTADPQCNVAGCGSCLYDYTYEVAGVDTSAPLAVTFTMRQCDAELEPRVTELELPVDERPEGILCRPINPGTLSWVQRCGAPHLPCAGADGACAVAGGQTTCDPGLVCAGDDFGICRTPCETDADCPLTDVEACEDGVCVVPAAF